MTLIKFNEPINRNINGWMDDIFHDLTIPFTKILGTETVTPRVNIKETPEVYHLEIYAPGRSKEDFKINIDRKLLTVSYDKETGQKNESESYIKREFNVQPFKRSFTLDDKIDSDNIIARYENGILNLQLPKKAEVKVSAKEIAVQ